MGAAFISLSSFLYYTCKAIHYFTIYRFNNAVISCNDHKMALYFFLLESDISVLNMSRHYQECVTR